MPSEAEARAALAAHPFPDNPWVRVTEHAVIIRAGYNEAMQRMLRWVQGAQWRPATRQWEVPLTGAELVRSILPELSRLAEAMQDAPAGPSGDVPLAGESAQDAQARRLFRDAARLLYGADWQRDTARALGREEAALARWLAGEAVAEAPPDQLLAELHALMQKRSREIARAAERFAMQLAERAQPE